MRDQGHDSGGGRRLREAEEAYRDARLRSTTTKREAADKKGAGGRGERAVEFEIEAGEPAPAGGGPGRCPPLAS